MNQKNSQSGKTGDISNHVHYNHARPSAPDLARGHWATIYARTLPELKQNQKGQPCPSCGGKDRFDLSKNWIEKGDFYCRGCGAGDGFSLLGKATGKSFPDVCDLVKKVLGIDPANAQIDYTEQLRKRQAREAAERLKLEQDAERNYHFLHQIMSQVKPLHTFEPGLNYFRHRGLGGLIDRGDLPLNWLGHPCLRYDEHQSFPAMLAPVAVNSQPVSLHRTYITPEGFKAPVEHARKLTPPIWPGATVGAAIRLYRPTTDLVVSEGIESGLAIRLACPDLPVWSCVTAGGLKSVLIPDGVTMVYIAADNDRSGTGQQAANDLQDRLTMEGIESVVIMPPDPGEGSKGRDWLDVVGEVAA